MAKERRELTPEEREILEAFDYGDEIPDHEIEIDFPNGDRTSDPCPHTLPLFEERSIEMEEHEAQLDHALQEEVEDPDDREIWAGDCIRYWTEGPVLTWKNVLHDTIMQDRESCIVAGITITLDRDGQIDVSSNLHLLEAIQLLARATHEVTLDRNLDPDVACLDGTHPASSFANADNVQ